MKKIPIFLLFVLTFISCDPPEHTLTHDVYWYVKNNTTQTFTVLASSRVLYSVVVNPGDSDYVYAFSPAQHLGEPSFDLLLWDTPQEERFVDIKIRGVLFKRWYYADKHAAGKQFFDESCWRLYTRDFKPGGTRLIYKWVFDIYPEDLFGDEGLPNQNSERGSQLVLTRKEKL